MVNYYLSYLGVLGVWGDDSDTSISVLVVVNDVYDCKTNVSTLVPVQAASTSGSQLNNLLSSSLGASLGAGDVDSALQSVNIISSSANSINCTLTTPAFCSSLHRYVGYINCPKVLIFYYQ
jgi:hypothetical protein